MMSRSLFGGALLLAVVATPLRAEPTEVVVRVISEDAKFVGDSMGGASVTLRIANGGPVLARGITTGGTGDTARIMQATGRSPLIATPEAAAFRTTIDIDQPTLVDLEVYGPNGRQGSRVRVVSQRWIMPGQPVNTGDGWIVELPGLAITPIAKAASGEVVAGSRFIDVTAKIELLCGCPITPGGPWDSAEYRVTVSVWQQGRRRSETPLQFVAAPGGFAGQVQVPAKGRYRLFVMAQNIRTGNSGVTELTAPNKVAPAL